MCDCHDSPVAAEHQAHVIRDQTTGTTTRTPAFLKSLGTLCMATVRPCARAVAAIMLSSRGSVCPLSHSSRGTETLSVVSLRFAGWNQSLTGRQAEVNEALIGPAFRPSGKIQAVIDALDHEFTARQNAVLFPDCDGQDDLPFARDDGFHAVTSAESF